VVCACAAKTATVKNAVKKLKILLIGAPPVSDVRPEATGRPVKMLENFRE